MTQEKLYTRDEIVKLFKESLYDSVSLPLAVQMPAMHFRFFTKLGISEEQQQIMAAHWLEEAEMNLAERKKKFEK